LSDDVPDAGQEAEPEEVGDALAVDGDAAAPIAVLEGDQFAEVRTFDTLAEVLGVAAFDFVGRAELEERQGLALLVEGVGGAVWVLHAGLRRLTPTSASHP